jgi:hypothetical protein
MAHPIKTDSGIDWLVKQHLFTCKTIVAFLIKKRLNNEITRVCSGPQKLDTPLRGRCRIQEGVHDERTAEV